MIGKNNVMIKKFIKKYLELQPAMEIKDHD